MSRIGTRIALAGLLVAVVALAGLSGCAQPAENTAKTPEPATTTKSGPEVKVASLLDSEGVVLGSMVIQMLEAERHQDRRQDQVRHARRRAQGAACR